MRVNMLLRYLGLALSCSARWLKHTTQIETPSLRYVKRSKMRATACIGGSEESRTTMGKLEDPNFRYIPKAESEKPGYLERRMKIYKEMVRAESQGIPALSQKSDNGAGNNGQVSDKSEHRLQSHKLSVVRGKA